MLIFFQPIVGYVVTIGTPLGVAAAINIDGHNSFACHPGCMLHAHLTASEQGH